MSTTMKTTRQMSAPPVQTCAHRRPAIAAPLVTPAAAAFVLLVPFLLLATSAHAQGSDDTSPPQTAAQAAEAMETESLADLTSTEREQEILDRAYALDLDENITQTRRRGRRRVIAGSMIIAAMLTTGPIVYRELGPGSTTDVTGGFGWQYPPSASIFAASVGSPLLLMGVRNYADSRLMRRGQSAYEASGELSDVYPDEEAIAQTSRRFRNAAFVMSGITLAAFTYSMVTIFRDTSQDSVTKFELADFSEDWTSYRSRDERIQDSGLHVLQFAFPTLLSATIQLFVASRDIRSPGEYSGARPATRPQVSVSPTRGGAYTRLSFNW